MSPSRPEQLLEHDPHLGPGQVGPEAVVGADAEGDVGVGAPVDAELVGRVEHVLVPVRRLVEHEHLVARLHVHTGPCRSWSSVTVRENESTGETYRMISSTAVSQRDGSAITRCFCSGNREKATSPPLRALRVVSLPATTDEERGT